MEKCKNELLDVSKLAVLFVDDEINILQAIKRLFNKEPFSVYIASAGEEALEILKNKPEIGLIVSDQRMPGLSGVDFLEKTKQIKPAVLRIILTGYIDLDTVAEAINRAGAYRFITKPWNDKELIQIIREGLQRYSLIQENIRMSEIIREQNEELKNWTAELEQMVQLQTMELSRQNDTLKKLNNRQKENFKSTISSLSNLIELRDVRVKNHSRNVAEIAIMVAQAMKLPIEELDSINVAALLHDIGKIGIPDIMLLKEVDELDAEELEEYKKHPIRGQSAINSIEDLRKAGILIRHHHEWFSGGGFPDNLKGDEIPLGSRIIAIADTIDRNMGEYCDERSIEKKLKTLLDKYNDRFDPHLIPFIEEPVQNTYRKALPHGGMVELELLPDDLKEGMMVSKPVRTGTGLLLMDEGVILTEHGIMNLKRYHRADPSTKGIFVWVNR